MKAKNNTYAQNKVGVIKSPRNPAANNPKSVALKGTDLRAEGTKKKSK